MQFLRNSPTMSASLDDPNLISTAGLVPIMHLAHAASLPTLTQDQMTEPTDNGAKAGAKITIVFTGWSRCWFH